MASRSSGGGRRGEHTAWVVYAQALVPPDTVLQLEEVLGIQSVDAGHVSDARGMVVLIAAAGLFIPGAGALLGKVVPGIVLFASAVRFAVTGID